MTFKQAVADSKWCHAMNVQVSTLEENDTWEITFPLPRRKPIDYKCSIRLSLSQMGLLIGLKLGWWYSAVDNNMALIIRRHLLVLLK